MGVGIGGFEEPVPSALQYVPANRAVWVEAIITYMDDAAAALWGCRGLTGEDWVRGITQSYAPALAEALRWSRSQLLAYTLPGTPLGAKPAAMLLHGWYLMLAGAANRLADPDHVRDMQVDLRGSGYAQVALEAHWVYLVRTLAEMMSEAPLKYDSIEGYWEEAARTERKSQPQRKRQQRRKRKAAR